MEKRELTCIGCPMGCRLQVTVDGETILVEGNQCPRGKAYGEKEVTAPVRSVTSTVPVMGGVLPVVSVKTRGEIPKDRIFACMAEIRKARAFAPVRIGDMIIENCAGTGVPVVATKNVGKAET